jgi:ABC-type Fe3+/spermidine/putrescine transport system ATPase subunit
MVKNPEFVKFDKVDKSYDGKILVVKDLQLDIEEGEFVTMLGPSGSGKTTCLMMLANIIKQVVLPEPEGPNIVTNSPSSISN